METQRFWQDITDPSPESITPAFCAECSEAGGVNEDVMFSPGEPRGNLI